MKKYIAPEMEIAKFAAQDIITASTPDAPVTNYIQPAADESYSFGSTTATYGEF